MVIVNSLTTLEPKWQNLKKENVMSKPLFILLQALSSIIGIFLICTGVDFIKNGNYREWLFVVGSIIIFIPVFVEFLIFEFKLILAQIKRRK